MEFSVNKRLVEIQKLKNFSWEELRLQLGVNKPQQISNWVNFKDKLPSRHIIKIIELFPDINARWFITGEGNITEQTPQHVIEEPKEIYNTKCPLCKEKDRSLKLLEKMVSELEQACANKDELLEVYRDKKGGNPIPNSA